MTLDRTVHRCDCGRVGRWTSDEKKWWCKDHAPYSVDRQGESEDAGEEVSLPIVSETHQQGILSVENLDHVQEMDMTNCDVGVQLHDDGRIWLCVNGIAFIRFRPTRN